MRRGIGWRIAEASRPSLPANSFVVVCSGAGASMGPRLKGPRGRAHGRHAPVHPAARPFRRGTPASGPTQSSQRILNDSSRRDEYDVCIIGSGAGGGMAAYALTRAGARVVVLEAGGPWDNMSSDSAMLKWPYDTQRRGRGDDGAAVRRVRCLHRRVGDRGRAVLAGAGHDVQLVAGTDGGRAHQSLGTHLAPVRARRLPPRRPGRALAQLADRLRRHQSLLRPARPAGRTLRQQRRAAQPARRHLHAAAAAARL